MKELTKAEEQIMQVLWELEEAVVRDIIYELPKPKPAYNTVSTIVRILEKKDVVGHRAVGKTHIYFPLIKKDQYRTFVTKSLIQNYFANNPKSLVSYFIEKEEIDLNEMDEIMKLIEQKKKK